MSGRAAVPRRTAVVVDDAKVLRRLLRRILEAEGFAVAEAGDGREALALVARDGPPDLLIADLRMPGMDGVALVAAFRADPASEASRVLVISAEDELEASGVLPGGVDGYIQKPFTAASIREVLIDLDLLDPGTAPTTTAPDRE